MENFKYKPRFFLLGIIVVILSIITTGTYFYNSKDSLLATTINSASFLVKNKNKISTCYEIKKPGKYSLNNDIKNSENAPCITIKDTRDVSLDCKKYAVTSTNENYSIYVKNVQNFSIQNCSLSSNENSTSTNNVQHMFRIENSNNGNILNNTIGGTFATISSSANIEIKNNTFLTTSFQVYQSNFINILNNTFSSVIVNSGAVVDIMEGTNNKLIGNNIDGKSDGIHHGYSAPPNIGADDVVVLKDQKSIIVKENNIKNSWECGIESLGFLNDSQIVNNKINNVALAGICGWHYLSLSRNIISRNIITNSPSLFIYFRDYDLRLGEKEMYFKDNYFESNKLISRRTDGFADPEYSSSINIHAPVGKGGGFQFPGFTDKQVVASNNIFKNNDFGNLLKAPILFPSNIFIDGGGNRCTPSIDIDYPINCKTLRSPRPNVVSDNSINNPPKITSIQTVDNTQGILNINQKASIYGTGLGGDLTIKIGNQEQQIVTVKGLSDTYAEFIVPSRKSSAVVSVTVTNSSGLKSNFYEVKINVPN